MAEYQAGLHRQVSIIFSEMYVQDRLGIRPNPGQDTPNSSNYDKWSGSENYTSGHSQNHLNNWSLSGANSQKQSLLAGTKRALSHFLNMFTSKKKREERRLADIRKHLLINIEG